MLRSTLPLGRIFDVDLRMHVYFPLLLVLLCASSIALYGGVGRGFGLWLALFFAVIVRELAKAIAAAYAGLRLHAVYLLPFGGVMAFRAKEGAALQTTLPETLNARWVNAGGPIANFMVGFLLAGFTLAVDPQVPL